MSKITVLLPNKQKVVIKSGSIQPDPKFLIIHATDGKYKFPLENVLMIFEEKEK